MTRAVIIGFAHMHVNEIAQYISDHEDFELVGFADIPFCIVLSLVHRLLRSAFACSFFTTYST